MLGEQRHGFLKGRLVGMSKEVEVGKDKRLYVRVDEEILSEWHEWSNARGLSMSNIVQSICGGRGFPKVGEFRALNELIAVLAMSRRELSRVRNNLNQLLKLEENPKVREVLEVVNKTLEAHKAVLGRALDAYASGK